MNLYTVSLSGMTCHACEQLITMDLEEAGLPIPESISAEEDCLTIRLSEDQKERLKEVIEASGKYVVDAISPTS